MISREKARSIVAETLAHLEQDSAFPPLVLIDDHTEEYSWGWVFYWESIRYFETGDVNDMLLGNFPFVVLRQDGSLLQTEGGRSLEDQIAELDQALGSTARRGKVPAKSEGKKKKFSLRNIIIFCTVIASAVVVVQVGIEAAGYLAVAYFIVAFSLMYLKAKLFPNTEESSTSNESRKVTIDNSRSAS